MHWFATVLFLAATAEVVPDGARQQELMNEIGSAVVLPTGAEPISSYGQNYTLVGPTEVKAIFFIPEAPLADNAACVHGDMKPCSKEEVARMIAENANRRAEHASAGERRWFTDESELPAIGGGGCSVITIRYDILQKRISTASCNGPI